MTAPHPEVAARPRKTTQLRTLLDSPALEFILEAHNGLSARIAEEAGFRGIWASGLALSAQFGVRDNNEASWTQVVDMVEFMTDVTSVPILLDGDTGYGNFNNMRRLVRKLEQRGVAGVCIEDKLFPKTNSFIDGERQALADIDEFCGKIAAGKDSQSDDDFCIVARVEAYIAGWDTAEAIKRAEAYRRAGADGILIHSAWSRPDQILEFAREWANRAPLVIVPTKYYSTPTQVFRDADISLVIWANHLVRAAVSAMQETARRIFQDESLLDVEDQVASVKEIFRLQGADELAEAERRYFLGNRREAQAVVLAASQGDGLADLTDDRPKVMLPVNGKPLLHRLVESCKRAQLDPVTVVAGYKADRIAAPGIRLVVNDAHASTGELASLACARACLDGDVVVMYGDLLFRGYVLRGLVESEHALTVVVDSLPATRATTGAPDYAYCSAPDDRSLWEQDVWLERVVTTPQQDGRRADGRWIGMLAARGAGARGRGGVLGGLAARADFAELGMRDLINALIEAGRRIHVVYVNGHWLDVNSLSDLEHAGAFTSGQR
ncbi:MAG: phosphoenolpyruvate mutase [Gammaproteobacteria bacterium]